MVHILTDALSNAILITGLVVVMMMMIESLNIESKGMFFKGLRKTRTGQVVIGALLGSIPGCMGGFATVSLYTHRMLSFGALVAMMIASSGDESFIMLAMIPQQALILFAVLFVLAIVVGIIVDKVYDRKHAQHCHKHDHDDCGVETDCEGFELHDHACEHESAHDTTSITSEACSHTVISSEACSHTVISSEARGRVEKSRHFGWRRICMFIGLAIFIAALATGNIGHEHSAHGGHDHGSHSHIEHVGHSHSGDAGHSHTGHTEQVNSDACSHGEACGHGHAADASHKHTTDCCDQGHSHSHDSFNLLSEDWMNVLFAGLSVIILFVLLFASDHFVDEHLWKHIIRNHLPTIFAWTFGVLLVLGIALQYVDIEHWTSSNTALMIILATLVGIIPESGPHLIFLTLYASGAVSFPVLLASSISQDGHASIPLLAESKKSFIWAKLINCAVALLAGFTAMLFI